MDKEQNPFQWPCAEPCLPITPEEPAWLQTPTSGLQSASFPCDFAVCGWLAHCQPHSLKILLFVLALPREKERSYKLYCRSIVIESFCFVLSSWSPLLLLNVSIKL